MHVKIVVMDLRMDVRLVEKARVSTIFEVLGLFLPASMDET